MIREPARSVPVLAEHDVVVLGGGPAGIAAAAAAARQGADMLLVERYGFLGGMGTAGGRDELRRPLRHVAGETRQVVHGVADELLERIDAARRAERAAAWASGPHHRAGSYDISAYKCAADELLLACRREAPVPCLRGRCRDATATASPR